MRTEHAVKGMGCREQENCYRMMVENAGPPLTHKSTSSLLLDTDWVSFMGTGLRASGGNTLMAKAFSLSLVSRKSESMGHVSGEITWRSPALPKTSILLTSGIVLECWCDVSHR